MPSNFNLILCLTFLLLGCSRAVTHTDNSVGSLVIQSTSAELLGQIRSELESAKRDYHVPFSSDWANKLSVKKYENFVEFLLSEVKLVDYSPDNCRPDQMACSFPDRRFDIYVNDNFFKISKVERISTLLHELLHHLTNYKHFVCFDKEFEQQISCDESLYSAYGVEVHFLTELSKKYPNVDAIAEKLRKRIQY